MGLYTELLDELIAFATQERFRADYDDMRAGYLDRIGQIFEDDNSFESRWIAFTERFVFNRVLASTGTTPVELFLEEHSPFPDVDTTDLFRSLTKTIHGVFQVQWATPELVKVYDMYRRTNYKVIPEDDMNSFQKGDIMEARLIPFRKVFYFTRSFCFHPAEAEKFIYVKCKAIKKAGRPEDLDDFLLDLVKMSLKWERSRLVAVGDVYFTKE